MSQDPSVTNPPAEAFGEATKGGLVAINTVVLLACTLSSAAVSVYADLAAKTAPLAVAYVAIAGWLLTLALALYLAGYNSGARGLVQSITRGGAMARDRPGFAALVLMISAGAVFTVWSRATAESGGVLARWLPQLQAVRDDTAAIRQVVTRAIPPAEQLARLGYTLSKEDICRALTEGQVDAWRLMQAVGLPGSPVAIAVGDGQYATCIEEALLSRTPRHGRWAELLMGLPNPNRDLDRLYLAQSIGAGRIEPLNIAALERAAGTKSSHRLSFLLAPLLMYAVWGGDTTAVRGLLDAGADPSASARVELLGSYPRLFSAITVSPLAEAERLDRGEIVALLKTAGARREVRAVRSILDSSSPTAAGEQANSSKPW